MPKRAPRLEDPHAYAIFRRMRFSSFAFAAVAVALSALAAPVGAQPTEERDWRKIATARDRDRIERWEELFSAAQTWVATMGSADSYGNPTQPFASIRPGTPVADIPARWVGVKRCRSVFTYPTTVTARDWFRCRIFETNGGWQIEKTTGSVLFKVRLFADSPLGIVALGDKSTYLRDFQGYTGTGDDWDLTAMLRYDGVRILRMFIPYERRYEVFEIDVGR
jgi:hypothetical protein